MRRLAISALLASASTSAMAHGGGLNAEGCHHERATGGYHCHRAPSSYSSAAQTEQACPAPTAKIHGGEEQRLIWLTEILGPGNIPRFMRFSQVEAIIARHTDKVIEYADNKNAAAIAEMESKAEKAARERDLLLQENTALKSRVKDLQGQVDLARTAIEALRKR